MFTILYDSYQEGIWFRGLHSRLRSAALEPFPAAPTGRLGEVLAFDRPDIVLLDRAEPILVVERTIEVPSGHNVGQRFARLAAAAQCGVPTVYFGPYAAYKHGGQTQGPRYMNLRLFQAIDILNEVENAAVVTIRWPVDSDYEVVLDNSKDERMKEFMIVFFELYDEYGVPAMCAPLRNSSFETRQEAERASFISAEVVRPEQYDVPPGSVVVTVASPSHRPPLPPELHGDKVVVYRIGMKYLRSDPYTGMALLYSYLYCSGMADKDGHMILSFPEIAIDTWRRAAARTPGAKHVRLYRLVADAIVFSDGYLTKNDL